MRQPAADAFEGTPKAVALEGLGVRYVVYYGGGFFFFTQGGLTQPGHVIG